MLSKLLIGVLTVSMLALALAAYSGIESPAARPTTTAATKPLSASRLFMLLPDGKVEISDPWARRVYRWDGRRWLEVEIAKLPIAQVQADPQ